MNQENKIMKKILIKFGITFGLTLSPMLAFAATKTLRDLVALVIGYFSVFMTLIIGLAVLTFIWNIYNYFFKPDADRTEAGKYVLYSVIGFFIILSFWGFVNILKNTLNLDTTAPSWWPFNADGGSSNSQGPGWPGGGIDSDGFPLGGSNSGGWPGGGIDSDGFPVGGSNSGGFPVGGFDSDFESTNDAANRNEMNSLDDSNFGHDLEGQSSNDAANAAEQP
jgi:hypothetical protein